MNTNELRETLKKYHNEAQKRSHERYLKEALEEMAEELDIKEVEVFVIDYNRYQIYKKLLTDVNSYDTIFETYEEAYDTLHRCLKSEVERWNTDLQYDLKALRLYRKLLKQLEQSSEEDEDATR